MNESLSQQKAPFLGIPGSNKKHSVCGSIQQLANLNKTQVALLASKPTDSQSSGVTSYSPASVPLLAPGNG